jgi:hypothetical protein
MTAVPNGEPEFPSATTFLLGLFPGSRPKLIRQDRRIATKRIVI